MTTKVVKGSVWTLAGQVTPLIVSLIATPFTIRLLGSEAYGVLLLIGLIPTYFVFADFGMSVTSTRFASAAFGDRDREREARAIRTAGLVAFISSSVVGIPIFIFSDKIIQAFSVPAEYASEAGNALKLASISFVFGILASVFNSPMLARLRMDLNQFTVAVPKILLAGVTPIILYMGGGVFEAVTWALVVSTGGMTVTLCISGRLLKELFKPGIDKDLLSPMLKFGGSAMVAAAAGVMLTNLEKLVLTSIVSVKALAYYSVAFLFANTATFFSQAMLQSLIPAFSQLDRPERRAILNDLYGRTIRLTLIWAVPTVAFLFIVSRPFFTIWAGQEFGDESTVPLYLLLCGLVFSLVSFVPVALIYGSGKNEFLAKLYWLELPVYGVLLALLVNWFGIKGAAAAWSIRIMIDSLIVIHFARASTGVEFRFSPLIRGLAVSTICLLPAVVYAGIVGGGLVITGLLTSASLITYFLLVWRLLLEDAEKNWIIIEVKRRLGAIS